MMTKVELRGAKGPFRLAERGNDDGRVLYLVTNDMDLLVAVWDVKELAETIKFGLDTGNIQIATTMEKHTEH